jgi:hypothetical protein
MKHHKTKKHGFSFWAVFVSVRTKSPAQSMTLMKNNFYSTFNMKKIIIVLLTLSLSSTMNAQVKFGIKGGLNASFISNNGNSSSMKAGLHAGGAAMIPFSNEKMGINPELLFSQKGGIENNPKVTTTLNYLSIPILFYYQPVSKIYLQLGPEFSFLLSAKGKTNGASTDVKNFYESFDKGIAGGASYNFFGKIDLYLLFVKGFKGISEVIVTDPLGNNDRKEKIGSNNVIQVGLSFDIGSF